MLFCVQNYFTLKLQFLHTFDAFSLHQLNTRLFNRLTGILTKRLHWLAILDHCRCNGVFQPSSPCSAAYVSSEIVLVEIEERQVPP